MKTTKQKPNQPNPPNWTPGPWHWVTSSDDPREPVDLDNWDSPGHYNNPVLAPVDGDDDNATIIDAGDGEYCPVTGLHQGGRWGDPTEGAKGIANARLIASAPDLYDALEALCDATDRLPAEGYVTGMAEAIDAALAALAKARGEGPAE